MIHVEPIALVNPRSIIFRDKESIVALLVIHDESTI